MVWHNIDPSIVAGFYIVRVLGIVRVNFRDTHPHYIGSPTVSVGIFIGILIGIEKGALKGILIATLIGIQIAILIQVY